MIDYAKYNISKENPCIPGIFDVRYIISIIQTKGFMAASGLILSYGSAISILAFLASISL